MAARRQTSHCTRARACPVRVLGMLPHGSAPSFHLQLHRLGSVRAGEWHVRPLVFDTAQDVGDARGSRWTSREGDAVQSAHVAADPRDHSHLCIVACAMRVCGMRTAHIRSVLSLPTGSPQPPRESRFTRAEYIPLRERRRSVCTWMAINRARIFIQVAGRFRPHHTARPIQTHSDPHRPVNACTPPSTLSSCLQHFLRT